MSDRTTKHAFAFVWVTVALDTMGIGLIIPVLPAVLRQLTGQDAAGASIYGGWLFFAYASTQFLFGPVIGGLSDAFGRRPVLLLSVLGLGVDHALTAFSPTVTWLFAGRLLAGMFGGSYTTANAYIADVTPPEERGKAFGLLGAAFGVGFILGPALGGVLGGFGPRIPFFVAAGLSVANFLYGLLVLPETHPKENRVRFQLFRASPIGSLVTTPGGPVVRQLAVALLALFLGHAVYPAIWPYWTSARFGWSSRTIGLSLAAYGTLNALTQGALVGPAIKRWGERRASIAASVLDVLSLLALGLITQGWMVFVVTVVTAPSGIAMPAMNAWMSKHAPAEEGRLQGTIGALEGLSSIVGPVLMSQLFGAFERTNPGIPFFAAAILIGIGVVVMWRLPRPDSVPS